MPAHFMKPCPWVVQCLVACAIGLAAVSAEAQQAADAVPLPEPERATEEITPWYGWQTLALDAAVIGSAIYLAARDDGSTVLSMYPLYVLSVPLIHLVHGQLRPAAISGVLRLFGPILGLALTVLPGAHPRPIGPPAYAVTVASLGVLVPIGIDAIFLTGPHRSAAPQITAYWGADGVRVGIRAEL